MPQDTSQPSFKILKIGNCNTLSGKGTLAYQVGCNPTSEIFFRITANSGGGWFSADWISLKVIISAIGKANKSFTSYALHTLFTGKSVNTPAFLFAALKQESLVAIDTDNPRCYVTVPPDTFMAEIKALIASGTNLKAKTIVTGKGATTASPKVVDDIPVIFPQSNLDTKKLKSEVNKS
ncbi:hypothetical protein [Methylotenera sp.]|uniref:hypothetical protein n=1 Tax=Methylotenera sp. TaxID=2051956 RepID=UPI002733F8A0|nr:hypothetical protein [Methylotenera sp.]MDP3005300.1 hypothetical protein [Methylotenera sp.]